MSMSSILTWMDTQLGRLTGLFAVVGSIGIAALMVITLVAVLWRYGFNNPIFGIGDLSVLTLSIVAAASVIFGARNNSHVSIDVISRFFGKRVTRWTDAIMRILAVAILAAATYALVTKACGFEKACITGNLSVQHRPVLLRVGGVRWGFIPCICWWNWRADWSILMVKTLMIRGKASGRFDHRLFWVCSPVCSAVYPYAGWSGDDVGRYSGYLSDPRTRGDTENWPAKFSAKHPTIPLTIIPLFVLMGNLAGVSGMSRDLYDAAHSWFGHRKGGLASATVVGCAGFSALSGSSLAAALTMGRVALPEMQRYKYDDGLATGSIAAGGTLGILIPPSAGFVLYAILTEESIGRLFLAGVLPGLLLTALFVVAITIVVWRDPSKAPQALSVVPMKERLKMLGRAGWILSIIVLTIGGIYSGVFSAVEAAGVGAALAFVVTFIRGAITVPNMIEVFTSTLRASGTLFMILFGAFVFKTFVGFTGITFTLAEWVEAQGYTGNQIVVVFLLMFIALGTFMEGFAILVLTVPLLQPILEPLGINMVWFGVLMVIVLEMGLISPPVGVNVFVVKGIAPNVALSTIFRGIWPFWFAMFACVILLVLFPQIALLLPNTMFG